MGELEGIGDAVTGGLLAGAVEPNAGEIGSDGHTHEKNCLNCGCKLVGDFCHCCGQRAHVHRTLRGFLQDFIQGLFNFEGKIWRTLPMLAWRPGEMTRRYVAGERARFVSPIALYLFTVFIMFAVLNFTGALSSGGKNPVGVDFKEAVAEQKASVEKLEKERAEAVRANRPVADIDRKLANEREDLERTEKLQRGEFVRTDVDDDTPEWAIEAVNKAQKNPELFVTNIQDAASKFSWLLIPLSVPFMWLIFPFSRRFHLYDHTVFVTYSLSFMMMLVILGGVLVEFNASALAGFLFFVPPFHMYRQLKGAYQLGRFGALWRTLLLTTFAFVAAALFFVVVAAVGVLG